MKFTFTSSILGCLLLLLLTNNAQARLRLIAVTNCYSDSAKYMPNDSTIFIYSGHRGGWAVYNNPYGWLTQTSCDTSYLQNYISASNTYYASSRTISTYDAHNNMLTQLHQQYDTTLGAWYNDTLYTNTYDANNNQLSVQIQLWDTSGGSGGWKNTTRHMYAYDASNNNIADTAFSWADRWTDSLLKTYSYDSYNYLVESQWMLSNSGSWYDLKKEVHALNAAHKPDSVMQYYWNYFVSDWVYSYKELYTYDGSYNMLTDTTFQFYTAFNMWGAISMYVYTYSGSDVASVEERFYSSSSSRWDNYSKVKMTYDGRHNLVTSIEQRWALRTAGYDDYKKEENTYNAQNLVTTYTTTTWDATTNSWVQIANYDKQSRFYYEPYTGLTVNNADKQASTLQLYPNPAGSYMNIAINNTDNEPLILTIYDMAGRQYKQWEAAKGTSYNATVPTTDLRAGNYIMQIKGKKGAISRQFSVVH